jgi:hypothetical protein
MMQSPVWKGAVTLLNEKFNLRGVWHSHGPVLSDGLCKVSISSGGDAGLGAKKAGLPITTGRKRPATCAKASGMSLRCDAKEVF